LVLPQTELPPIAGKESAKPLALVYIMQTAMKSTVPLLPDRRRLLR